MKINEVSLKYAAYSTLYIAVAILVFYFLLFGGLGIIANSFYWIPVLSTFLSGYYIFTKIKKAWLLGITHYILAHIFVFLFYFIVKFMFSFKELGITKPNLTESFEKGIELVMMSLVGSYFILPCFVLGGYFLSKKLFKNR